MPQFFVAQAGLQGKQHDQVTVRITIGEQLLDLLAPVYRGEFVFVHRPLRQHLGVDSGVAQLGGKAIVFVRDRPVLTTAFPRR